LLALKVDEVRPETEVLQQKVEVRRVRKFDLSKLI
jgi:hypothetical protein